MRARVWLVLAAGALALVGACGDDSPYATDGKSGRAGGHQQAGGAGGAAGAAGGMADGGAGRRGSPSPLPAPSTQLPPGSWCEADGWCWYNPLPSGNFRRAVAGAGRTDLWIGGESFLGGPSSNVLHFDGGRWNIVPSPLGAVFGIWAASDDDVWFVGDDSAFLGMAAIAHWDGAAMTVVASAPASVLTDVWGAGANDIYAVGGEYGGGNEIAMHWDGSAWTPIAGIGGTDVAGSGPNDVWIGGPEGLLHFDGTGWSHIGELAGEHVTALTVAAPGDVWLVVSHDNPDQLVAHIDASGVTVSLQVAGISERLTSISASSPQNVWLVGIDSSGGGNAGYLNRYDGQSWRRAPSAPTALDKVASVPGFGELAVGANGGIVGLTSVPALGFTDLRSGDDRTLVGTFGSSPTDMWAVGDAGAVWHYDGQAVRAVPAGSSANFKDVWGTGPNDVWAVGASGTVLHYDGRAFNAVASGTTVDLHAVFTARPDDVWIGGDGPTLLHWDGNSMTPVTLVGAEAGTAVLDLHGIAAGDVWLSGGGFVGTVQEGYVAHFDGAAWTAVEVLTFSANQISQPLYRIWQLAPDDVWVAAGQLSLRGGGPYAYWHFDGTAWSERLFDPSAPPSPETFMFPSQERPSFVFGPHDRWRADLFGIWQRNTN